MKVYVINGPNLNMLGLREPSIYGAHSYEQLVNLIEKKVKSLKMKTTIFQSNYEGRIVEIIQQAILDDIDAIIINPAAYSHYSIAILDALKAFNGYKVEVHLSDVSKRERFRQIMMTAQGVDEVISGQGFNGYLLALDKVKNKLG